MKPSRIIAISGIAIGVIAVLAGLCILSSRGFVQDYIRVFPASSPQARCEVDLSGYFNFTPVLVKGAAFDERDKTFALSIKWGLEYATNLHFPEIISYENDDSFFAGKIGFKSAVQLSKPLWLLPKNPDNPNDSRNIIQLELQPNAGDSTCELWLDCIRPGWMIFGGKVVTNAGRRIRTSE